MTVHWFLGGPRAGWHESYGGYRAVRYPIMPRVMGFVTADADALPSQPYGGVGTYTRRRVRLPGWLVVLTVYTCDEDPAWRDPDPRIPWGTELPGVIWGVPLEMCGTGAWRLDMTRDVWRLRSGLVRAEIADEMLRRGPGVAVGMATRCGVALPPEAIPR